MDIYEEYQEKHNQFEKFKRYVDEYNKNPLVHETYLNEDDVRYCKNCNSPIPKASFDIGGHRLPLTKPCNCRDKYIKAENEIETMKREFRVINYLKTECFPQTAMYDYIFPNSTGDEQNMKIMRRYAEKWDSVSANNIGLLLWGDVGTGKTYAAACIANHLILEHRSKVKMTNFAAILNDLMNVKVVKNEYIDSLCKYDLLIIDDLGIERNTSFATEQVFNVIDKRYQTKKPLIVTTNLTLDFIKNPQNVEYARIYDRIREMCTPIQFKGENMRTKAAKGKLEIVKSFLEED